MLSLVFLDDYDTCKHFLQAECPFTSTSTKEEIAYHMMDYCKKEANSFCTNRLNSFTTNAVTEDREYFYLHLLINYIPVLMKRTYNTHNLGLGTFTIEVFEYKKYSSKYAICENSNRKGNVCRQRLKYIILQFIYRTHKVKN